MADRNNGLIEKSDAFIIQQLNMCADNVGEIIVHPDDTEEELEARLTHPGIRGFKCYHNLSGIDVTWNATIDQYLPESAWAVANRRKMVITLHMVRDHALADERNQQYIRTMAKKYPDAVLILAHCARSFASWTAVESIATVADLDNVWFDFSAVCESPAMLQILKKAGTKKCMWGSDYPVCRSRGKCISLADSFYWIYQNDLDNFASKTRMNSYLIGTENLMAVRQAFILAELGEQAVEDFFWNNAVTLFSR
jgi:glutamate-1-semialdehyde 2,1-aminomutase